jgi:hypothetical protein
LLLLATVRIPAVLGRLFFSLSEIMVDSDGEDIIEEDPADTQAESCVWKYFVDFAQYGTRGASKNSQCRFCDRSFTGISTTRAVSHVLGSPVMGQSTAGIKVCSTTKKEEDRRADLKKTRDELGGNIREKEAALNKKRKHVVMDSLLTPRIKRCFSSMCMRTARSSLRLVRLEPVANSKCSLGKLKELTVKSVCAVRAPRRADAHKTYILITQVVASDLVQCEIPAVHAQNRPAGRA